jgi:phosphomannomutase/phosphoglucomutase
MMVNPHIFREYDIRGTVDRDLTPGVVELLGKGIGTRLRRSGKDRFVLGRDNRLSSPAFREAMVNGLLATGVHVVDLGLVPTPLLYFALHTLGPDGGVMITGSHNPPEFNGFKVAFGKSTIWGESIQEIRHIIDSGEFFTGSGTLTFHDIAAPYREKLLELISLDRPLRVAVDGGSGTGGMIAPAVLRDLGCEVTELYCTPDGSYPGHFPDPTIPSNLEELIEVVREKKLDMGVAYDGDSDRIGVVDDRGNILWGDQLLIIYAREILQRGPATVIFEVKCSQNLAVDILEHGGKPVMWKTGHSLIKEKMKEEKAALAGEMSGHIFFADEYYGYDDAIYATLRLLRIMAASRTPLSGMLDNVPPTLSTPEIRVDCPDGEKFAVVGEIAGIFRERHDVIDVDGVRVTYPDGWSLLRASNTQPVLVLRFEALTKERLHVIKEEMLAELRRFSFIGLPDDL